MSIASTPTKLPLATFAKILGIHPLHFAGIEFTPNDRSPNICESALMQFSWQEADRVAREELAQAIATAEEMIETQLKFHLVPTWDTEEWQRMARPVYPEFFGYTGTDIRGFATPVKLDWGYILTGGVETKTLIDDVVPINWSDEDGDGLEETGTVVATIVAGTPACEVEIYYPGHDGDPEWQIRPFNVSLAGLVATITFRRELAVSEAILFSMLDPQPAQYIQDADFLETVDVYRHYNDPSQQATIMWDPRGECGSCGGGGGCMLCAYAVQSACIHLRSSPKAGLVGISAGEYDTETNQFNAFPLSLSRTPDVVRLFYYSGLTAKRGCISVMDPQWARTVAYLAVTLLDRPLCDCTENVWKYWREDLALLSGGEDQTSTYSFETRKAAGGSPFGTRRGALYAWRRVLDPNVARVDSAVLV